MLNIEAIFNISFFRGSEAQMNVSKSYVAFHKMPVSDDGNTLYGSNFLPGAAITDPCYSKSTSSALSLCVLPGVSSEKWKHWPQ